VARFTTTTCTSRRWSQRGVRPHLPSICESLRRPEAPLFVPKPPRTVTPGPAATTARPVPNTTRRARRAAAAGLALTGLLDLFGWPVGMGLSCAANGRVIPSV
jgi:hypothetical protein